MAEIPEQPGQSALPKVPRRNVAAERLPDGGSPMQQLVALADGVKVLADQISSEPVESTDPAQERALRRKRKFQRMGAPEDRRGEEAGDDDGSPLESAPGEQIVEVLDEPDPDDALAGTALNRSIAWPRLARAETARLAMRPKRRRRSTTGPLLVLMACNLAMLVFGYWIGQSAASGPTAGPASKGGPAAPVLRPVETLGSHGTSERAMDAANAALKAEKSGDVVTARHLYEDILRQRLGLEGAEYRLALLAVKRGDLLDADLHLTHSTRAGEYVAQSHYVRATFAGARGNYGEASQELEAAVYADPFNAKYYFCWGESLRRDGKPRAGANCLEQALDRSYNPEEGSLYFFKLGLAKVEFGLDDDFNDSITRHLQRDPEAGIWLLFAAAQDIERNDFKAAAGHLQNASNAMPEALFLSYVRDYVFQSQADKPEIAGFLNRTVAPLTFEAGASVMDPASWSPDKADPGAWPTAGASRR